MTDRRRLILGAHPLSRGRAMKAVEVAPDGYIVDIREPARNLDQNALMWVYLQAFSDQLEWPVNGRMEKLAPEEWKDLLSAAFKQELQRVAPGLNGGMVLLGLRTSKFGKRQFADFITFIQATAADRGVTLEELAA
jgi:ABC-type Fe3+ transport system substrate-binding protein